ncbi:hypothetical protein D3C81_2094170 [compost metagenome]
MLDIQAEDRLVDGLARCHQSAAEETAAGEHGKTWTQWNISMIAGPHFTYHTVLTGDFFHLVTGHPHAALAYKLTL